MMNIYNTNLVFFLLISAFKTDPKLITQNNAHSTDSLLLHVYVPEGKYVYKFQTNEKTIVHTFDKGSRFIGFYIKIDSTLRDEERIDLDVYIKKKHSKKFNMVNINIHYNKHKKYCILYRDKRIKISLSFLNIWTDNPTNYFPHIQEKLFDQIDSNKKYQPHKIRYH